MFATPIKTELPPKTINVPSDAPEILRSGDTLLALVNSLMCKEAAASKRMLTLSEQPSSPDLEFVKARRGGIGVRRNGLTLDSLYNPADYAEQLVAEQDFRDAELIVLVGCGGGAVPAEVMRVNSDEKTQIAVYEPDERTLCGMFQRAEGLEEYAPAKIQYFTSSQSLMLHISHLYRKRGKLLMVCPPSYRTAFAEEMAPLFATIKDALVLADVNANTSRVRARQWVRNLLRNIQKRSEHPSLFALEGQFADVPAIIVSAGPSLDRNVHLLNAIRDDVLIICVNTSLKALFRAGVKPHMVMSLESLNVSSHFKGDEEALAGVTLVLDETCHPSLFELPAERLFTFLESSPAFLAFAERASKSVKREKGVCVGGSIANAAFSCANLLGCDPIVLIGQDLAYTNNQVYASGTVFEGMSLDTTGGEVGRLVDPTGIKQQILDDTEDGNSRTYYADRALFPVRSWDGEGTVNTSMDFNLFRYWFQEAAAHLNGTQDITLINATEGGARIEGFDHIPLSDVIADYVKPRVSDRSFDAMIEAYHHDAPRLAEDLCNQALTSAYDDCEALIARTERAVELLETVLAILDTKGSGSAEFERALMDFESVEQTLGRLGRENTLVEACIRSGLETILAQPDPLKADELDMAGKWRMNLAQSREVLDVILAGAHEFLEDIVEV